LCERERLVRENARLRQQVAEARNVVEQLTIQAQLYIDQREMTLAGKREAESQLVTTLVELLDGQTEPLHPVAWLVDLAKAKSLLAAPERTGEPR
jgi:hypothetical protein